MKLKNNAKLYSYLVATLLLVLIPTISQAQVNPGEVITTDLTLTGNLDASGYSGPALSAGANNITIDGAGYTITVNGNNFGFEINGRNGVTIKNVTVVGAGSGQGRGLNISSSSNLVIQNNTLSGLYDAIYASGAGSNNLITGNDMSDCGSGFGTHHYGNNNQWTITNNIMTGNSGWAINYRGTPAVIDGNDFTGSAYGLNIDSANPGFGNDFIMSWQGAATGTNQNTFGGHTGQALQLNNSHYLDVSGWDFTTLYASGVNIATKQGLVLNAVSNSNFSGNTFDGMGTGVYASGAGANTTVHNNSMIGCGTGFGTHHYGNNNQWTITNNIMTGSSGWAINYRGTPAVIDGNDFTGSAYGLNIDSANPGFGNDFIMSWQGAATGTNQNTFGGHTGQALQLNNSHYLDVSGWDFTTLYASGVNIATKQGLVLNAVSNSNFSGNTFDGMGTGVYASGAGANTTVHNNSMIGCGTGFGTHHYGNNNQWTITNNIMTGSSGWAINYRGTPAVIDGNDFTGSAYGLNIDSANPGAGNDFVMTWQGAASGPNQNTFGDHTQATVQLNNSRYLDISGWDFPTLYAAGVDISTKQGLHLNAVSYSNFANNTLTGFGTGIYTQGTGHQNVVHGNDLSDCGTGIASNPHNCNNVGWTITGNDFTGSTGWAINSFGGPAEISSNDFTGSGNGVYLRSASNRTYDASTNIWDLADAATAFSVEYSSNTTIENLSVVGDGGTGVYVGWNTSNVVIDGLETCGDLGVNLQRGSGHIVRNSSFANAGTGIHIQYANNVQIQDNSFYDITTEVGGNVSAATISGSQTVSNNSWCPGAPVPTEQTFTILGANGNIGDIDPYTQASLDGGVTWQQAYLTGGHPWGLIPGTNSWVNYDPDNTVGLNTRTPYRIRFMVPADFTNPSMVFTLKADNRAIIWINDTYIDSVDGSATPNVPDQIVAQALHPGLNEIRLTMVDWGGIVGLNYKIDVTMTSAEDISGAVLTPDDAAELNNPPLADAGADQAIDIASASLDGSGSSDPDGNILSYSWSENGNVIATGIKPTIALVDGSHTITLTVSDGELSATDQVIVVVSTNAAPIADAGSDQSIDCATGSVDVTLDGSGSSDADGDALTYSWSLGGSEVATSASFTASLAAGSYAYTLTVSDGMESSSDAVSVTVVADTEAPAITLLGDNPMNLGLYLAYTEAGYETVDACGSAVTVAVTGTINVNTPGSDTLTYTATDAGGNFSSVDRVVEVFNTAPTVENAIGSFELSFGDEFLSADFDLGAVFTDVDTNDVLSYSFSNSNGSAASVTLSGSLLTVSAIDLGATVIEVTATDPWGASVIHEIVVTVDVTQVLADAVVFGIKQTEFKKAVQVLSGNILVNGLSIDCDYNQDDNDGSDHGGGGHGGGGYGFNCSFAGNLKIDRDVEVAGGYQVQANCINLQRNTEINSDVYYNFLDNNRADIYGDEYSPIDVPLFTTLPPFKSAPAGMDNITVNKNQTAFLSPGDYSKIDVKDGGILTLSGGVYNIKSIKLSKRGELLFADAAEMRVEEKVEVKKQTYVGPSDGSFIDASDIIFYVKGQHGNDDDDDDQSGFCNQPGHGHHHGDGHSGGHPRKVVKIEQQSMVFVNFYAPDHKIELHKDVIFTGALYAWDVKVDQHSDLTLDSFFNIYESGLAKQVAWSKPAIEWLPEQYVLEQNYPNPFNPSTTINYAIPNDGMVSMKIYNLLGQEVANLVNEFQEAGYHQVVFEAGHLSSGVYLAVMQSAEFIDTRKIILIK